MATLLVTSAASTAPNPLTPRLYVILGIAFFVGLVVGICLAILREAFDRTVRDRSELEVLTASTVLAIVPFESDARRRPLAIGDEDSSRAESYRYLRTNLGSAGAGQHSRVIVVTSSIAGEGTSTTCVNVAAAAAEAGRKVLIIDGNLRRPRLDDYLHVDGEFGLSDVLAGELEFDAALRPSGSVPGLAVLASGEIPVNPSALLDRESLSEVIRLATLRFDVIIVDSPPLLSVSDAALWARQADGAVLVVQHGGVSRDQVTAAVTALRVVGAPLLGVVLNMVRTKGTRGDGNDRLVEYPSAAPRTRHEHIPASLRR
jgi:non-specific protein-tyrosine kinase